MTRDPIAELHDKIKDAFTIYASVALGRINRYLEAAGIAPENRINNKDGAPKVGYFECVDFHAIVNGSELPATMLLPEATAQHIKTEQSELFRDLVSYIDKVLDDLCENMNVAHPVHYDLQYGVHKTNSDLGFGLNLPISNSTATKLYELAARLLAAYPLDRLEKQINREVSLQLPFRILEDALIAKKHEAQSDNPEHIERRGRFPIEFDLAKINELLAKLLEKRRIEEKATPREI